MAIHLRPATEADLASLANVALAAFDPATDAIARRLFPSHLQPPGAAPGEAHRNWTIMRKSARLRMASSAVVVAVDDALGGEIVGYACWFVPLTDGSDEPPPAPPRKTVAGTDPAALVELRKTIMADEYATFGAKGSRDVWSLDSIGVPPRHQRRGIGRALLDWGVRQAAAQGRDCYLVATPAGVALYAAAGFEAVRTVDVFGEAHVSMIRRGAAEQGRQAGS
jgi:ribosomal protein S18 acetylase RimI-like enzyme